MRYTREKEKGGNESEEEYNFIMFQENIILLWFIYISLEKHKIVFVYTLTTYAAKNL